MEKIMQVNFTGHGIEITPALKAFSLEKLGKLSRHSDSIIALNVVFDVQ
jgi:putative sigma-54 modulation protein